MIADQDIRDAFEYDGIINSSLTMAAVLLHCGVKFGAGHGDSHRFQKWTDDPLLHQCWLAMERMDVLVKRFDRDVWIAGFGKAYLDMPYRRYEAPFGDDSILCSDMAGRVLLTFQLKDGGQFTLITADNVDESRMGTQSIMCTEKQFTKVITDATDAFASGGLGIKHNANVKIAGT